MTRPSDLIKAGLRSSRLLLFALMILALTLTSIPNAVVLAASGDLDPAFGNGGKVVTDFAGSGDTGRGAVLQPDGKLVVVGSSDSSFALTRYHSDGNLDTSFGSAGKVTTYFSGGSTVAFDVALQSDGQIVVAGADNVGFALARYHSDGSLDMSFGVSGKVTTAFSDSSSAFSLAIQADGKIVAAGYASTLPTRNDFAVVRYNTDGSLDLTFGSGGKVTFDFFGQSDTGLGVAIQPGNKIVVAGMVYNFITFDDFALIRLNNDGTIDQSFGSGGKVITDFSGRGDLSQRMLIQPDGKIVVAGSTANLSTGYDFALVRYNPNGVLDTTFGSDGKATTDFANGSDMAFAVALTSEQKIVVAGVTSTHTSREDDFAIARFASDGSLDANFGVGGKVTTDFGAFDSAQTVIIQPDGKIIAAGMVAYRNSMPLSNIAVARYLAASAFDICIQDESTDNLLQLNTTTGEYQISNCAGLTISGTGTVIRNGSVIKFRHNSVDRSIAAKIKGNNKATASVQLFSTGATFSIIDKNITNNTCACR